MDTPPFVRSSVRTFVPIFPKIRALEFSAFFYLKIKKNSKKVKFSLFHQKFENGHFLAKNGPKSAFFCPLPPPPGGGVKNIFYWAPAFRICTDCLLKYEWNLLKIGLKNPYFQVCLDFQLFQHPGKLAKFRPNLGQFWPKRAIFQISLKTQSRHYF